MPERQKEEHNPIPLPHRPIEKKDESIDFTQFEQPEEVLDFRDEEGE